MHTYEIIGWSLFAIAIIILFVAALWFSKTNANNQPTTQALLETIQSENETSPPQQVVFVSP